jgi:hypothetical protein
MLPFYQYVILISFLGHGGSIGRDVNVDGFPFARDCRTRHASGGEGLQPSLRGRSRGDSRPSWLFHTCAFAPLSGSGKLRRRKTEDSPAWVDNAGTTCLWTHSGDWRDSTASATTRIEKWSSHTPTKIANSGHRMPDSDNGLFFRRRNGLDGIAA